MTHPHTQAEALAAARAFIQGIANAGEETEGFAHEARTRPEKKMLELVRLLRERAVKTLAAMDRSSPPAEEIANLPTEQIARWMIEHGYATGHGDTVADLLCELEWQAKERGAASPPAEAGWRDIASAPRDGTMLSLLVDYSGEGADHALEDALISPTIGFNSFDDNGEDEWKFSGWCWCHDHFVQGRGRVLGWLPWLRALPPPPKEPT